MIIEQGLIQLPTTPQAQTEGLLFSQKSAKMPPLLIMAIDGGHVDIEVPKGRTKKKVQDHQEEQNHLENPDHQQEDTVQNEDVDDNHDNHDNVQVDGGTQNEEVANENNHEVNININSM